MDFAGVDQRTLLKTLNIKILYKDGQRKWRCFISGRYRGGELCRLMEKKLQLELQNLEVCVGCQTATIPALVTLSLSVTGITKAPSTKGATFAQGSKVLSFRVSGCRLAG